MITMEIIKRMKLTEDAITKLAKDADKLTADLEKLKEK